MTENKSTGSEGFEEKAANVLNVVMVVAIGTALGCLGFGKSGGSAQAQASRG